MEILNQPPNFLLPQLFVIKEIRIIKNFNVDPLLGYFLNTPGNIKVISEDCMVPGFLNHDKVNEVHITEFSLIVVIIIVNHSTHFYDGNCKVL